MSRVEPIFSAYDTFRRAEETALVRPAGNASADFAPEQIAEGYARALEQELAEHPLTSSTTARPVKLSRFVSIVRAIAGCLMLFIWTLIVGPIWFAVLLRTISAYSVATVIAVFSGRLPPSPERLDAISGLWMLGFQKIMLTTFKGTPEFAPHLPIDTPLAIRETLLAILFYTAIFISLRYVVALIVAFFDLLTAGIVGIFHHI
jgi:hypothetical protein